METAHTAQRTTVALVAVGLSLFLAKSAQADPITFSNTPASSVVLTLGRQYGISIVFKSDVNFTQPVSFSVDDIAAPGGRLQAVRRLANSLGMDFQKVYIVSKIDSGTTVPSVKIDNDGPIEFSATRIPVQEAIQEIAAVDGATAEISGVVAGSVVFPHRLTTASKAAATVARQTKTVWKAYYGFFQRPGSHARSYSAPPNIAPPVEALPAPDAPVPATDIPTDPLPNTPTLTTTNDTILPMVLPPPYGDYGYGNDPYAYGNPYGYGDPYASNLYAAGSYGYPDSSGGAAYPSNIFTLGSGIQPGGPGATFMTVSPPSVTVLPDYPFQGNYGDPVYSSGY